MRSFCAPDATAGEPVTSAARASAAATDQTAVSTLIESNWLAERLGSPDVRIIDLRTQPKHHSGHIAGAACLNPESVRGAVGGVSSMLLPVDMLARLARHGPGKAGFGWIA